MADHFLKKEGRKLHYGRRRSHEMPRIFKEEGKEEENAVKGRGDPLNPLTALLFKTRSELPPTAAFEIVSQHLVFANCIPLILKFFNQNIMSYISAKNRAEEIH
ncbi:hypothetical protein CRUP_038404 [Coryphaenoides rupestris]|nr:hypothetical protein CRUP_038404 [Coryphaenoides rupestris]